MLEQKEYLGDGAYVDFDGYHIVLTTENGYRATNTISLEPSVLKHFLDYVKRLEEFVSQKSQGNNNESGNP